MPPSEDPLPDHHRPVVAVLFVLLLAAVGCSDPVEKLPVMDRALLPVDGLKVGEAAQGGLNVTRGSRLFKLNATHKRLWDQADGQTPLSAIAEDMAAHFQQPVGRVRRDVERMARDLVETQKLLKWAKPAASGDTPGGRALARARERTEGSRAEIRPVSAVVQGGKVAAKCGGGAQTSFFAIDDDEGSVERAAESMASECRILAMKGGAELRDEVNQKMDKIRDESLERRVRRWAGKQDIEGADTRPAAEVQADLCRWIDGKHDAAEGATAPLVRKQYEHMKKSYCERKLGP